MIEIEKLKGNIVCDLYKDMETKGLFGYSARRMDFP